MKKNLFTLLALCAFLLLPNIGKATDYTIEPTTATKSNTLPLFRSSASMRGSIVQQIYLPSEFSPSGATAGDITAVTFYYAAKDANTAEALSRDIEIWLMETNVDSYSLDHVNSTWNSKFLFNGSKKAGTKVYDGVFQTNSVTSSDGVQTVKLTFDTPFSWDGISNIVLTVYDKSTTNVGSNANSYLKFYITATTHARFVHQQWIYNAYSFTDDRADWINNLDRYGYAYGSGVSDSIEYADKRNYVPKTTFSITPAAVVIPVPENLSTTSVSTTSARLLWDAVDGATGYNVQWGTNSGSLDHSAEGVTNTYLDIDELQDGTTYYFAVQTVKDEETSAFSEEESFETTAVTITYKGIVFKKWNSTSALPDEAGSYYLNADVALSAQYTIPGDINLCLNGNELYTYVYNIEVPNDASLALYDNIGGGRIYGRYVANMSTGYGVISVENGGELVLGEGAIENLYGFGDAEDSDASYAISVNNGGTFKLSGAPVLSAAKACIYLLTNNPKITIESGKPLTNLSAYSVDATAQTITSGWANMSGADPNVYLVSAKSGYKGILLNGGEVKLVPLSDLDLSLSESTNKLSELADALGNDVSLAITRSPLTNEQYNTICLPYAMSNAEMQLRFGVGYDLEEFVSSSLDGDMLSLEFNQVNTLVAGKPYLLKPALNAPALSYVSVEVGAANPVDQTSDTYISFHGTFAPTELEGGNKNLLFLGAGNELFWPAADGNIKGFRAYFEVKGAAQKNGIRARIVKKEDMATGFETVSGEGLPVTGKKILRNGQLFIIRDDKTYNAQGQLVK